MAQYTAPICQICIGEQTGEHYCRQCEQFFCGNCKSSHLRTKISKNHTFVIGLNINKEEKLLCTEHEESFLFYCHDCETPVCRICSVKKHSRHLMTDLTETTLELKSEVSKVIISKITESQFNISRIKEETKTYREEVEAVIKTITDEANYWKQLIDKKVKALIKEVQDKEQKEIQNMTAYRELNEGVVGNCETWQKDIKTMETTADILLFKKLKQLKPEVDKTILKPIPNAPFISYRNKKPLRTEIDSLFGEITFGETIAIAGQIDNQQSASGSKESIRKIDSQQSASGSKDSIRKIDSQQSASGSKDSIRKINSQQSASKDSIRKIDSQQSASGSKDSIRTVDSQQSASGSKDSIRKIDSQQSASGSKDIIGKIDSQQIASETKGITGQIDNQQSARSLYGCDVRSSLINVNSSSLDGRKMEVPYQYAAAIDIGTTYSGFAFSTRVEKMSIYTCEWRDTDLTSSKTPTSVLLNKQKEFVAFGYEADNKYTQIIIPDEEMNDFYYFRRFKMMLHDERLTLDTEIEEERGKKMKALDVFCIAIKYLKEQLITKIKSKYIEATDNDIRFVLTVPSLWSDEARIFMKTAAVKAGIDNDQLILALEPVAASINCHELRLDFDRKENKFLPLITPGMKYMVIDLGGGTADITVHQCQNNESFEEVIPPSGGPWGGTAVDQAFLDFMIELFGEDVMERLMDEELEDYFYLLHDFEIRKRSIKPKGTDDRDIRILMSTGLMELIKQYRGGISPQIRKSRYKDSVSFHGQYLLINADTFRTLFKSTIEKLIQHLRKIFYHPELSDLKNVIMVGGFSECELVRMAVRNKFGLDRKIIIPDESGLAVLKGAVLFGHQKKITQRI